MLSAQILQFPDYQKDFINITDASKVACGAVQAQLHDDIELPLRSLRGNRPKESPSSDPNPVWIGHRLNGSTLHSRDTPTSKCLSGTMLYGDRAIRNKPVIVKSAVNVQYL